MPASIPLYRLVHFQLERADRHCTDLPLALQRGKVLSAVYRVGPYKSATGTPSGYALRLLVEPKRRAPAACAQLAAAASTERGTAVARRPRSGSAGTSAARRAGDLASALAPATSGMRHVSVAGCATVAGGGRQHRVTRRVCASSGPGRATTARTARPPRTRRAARRSWFAALAPERVRKAPALLVVGAGLVERRTHQARRRVQVVEQRLQVGARSAHRTEVREEERLRIPALDAARRSPASSSRSMSGGGVGGST